MSTVELAQRAVAPARGDALAQVIRERSLMLRFADGRPTQATAVNEVSVELAVVRDGHVGRAATNDAGTESLAACARRAEAAAEAAAAASRPGAHPGFGAPPGSARPRPSHDGHDPATAELDPSTGGAALSSVFAVAAGRGLSAHGIWSAGEEERAVATSSGLVRHRPHHGRLHEGHLHGARRPLRLRGPGCGGRRRGAARAACRTSGRQGRRRRATRPSCPLASTPW